MDEETGVTGPTDASQVIIDYFCLPDEHPDIYISEEAYGDIQICEALARELEEDYARYIGK